MDASLITALSALVGASVGGLTSVTASWLTQRSQAREQWIAREHAGRQEIYMDFIEEAAKCHVHALQNDEPDIPGLVELYAKIDRMAVYSSAALIDHAEQVGRTIVDTYLDENRTFPQLHEMLVAGQIRLLKPFSEACRFELELLRKARR